MNIHVAPLNIACRPLCALRSALALSLLAAVACGGQDDVVQLDATDPELAGEALAGDPAAVDAEIASTEQALRRPALELFEVDRTPVAPEEPDVAPVELTVSECTWLGGSVVFWASCGGTLMKCVGANGRETCIDEIKATDD